MTIPSPTPTHFHLRTLGSVELCGADSSDGSAKTLLGPGKPLALLAYCCCSRDREHSRDFLASMLWGDADSTRARQSLRQAVWRLRQFIGDRLHTRDDAVLGIDASVEFDREQFLNAVHRGDAAAASIAYGGPFLNGLTVPGGDEFEDWAALERRHLEDSLLRVVEPYAKQLLQSGRPALARELVERLVVQAPDSLDARRIAVEVLLDSGDRLGARREADALESIAGMLGGRAPLITDALITRARNTDAPAADEPATAIVLDLVGREDAFGTALAAWNQARKGESQVVVLSGIAGVGKSRLLNAIAQRCASRRSLAVSVRANAGERDVPFAFAAAMARALAAQPGGAGISAESARELVALDPGLGSHFATTPSREDGGEAVRRRALAMLDLVSAICEQEPLALFLDDLHWVDAASRQLLGVVLGRAGAIPLFVVATTRGSESGAFDERLVVAVALLPLSNDHVIDAIRSSGLWPETVEASRFIETLSTVCEGIPLNVMEQLALVREQGMLVLANGLWTSGNWTKATAALAVASPLDKRLDGCSDVERTVLLTLAVAGTPLTESEVTRTSRAMMPADPRPSAKPAGGAEAPVAFNALSTLDVRGLVVRSGDSWFPSHDVVAERMLARAPDDTRTLCHLALARTYAAATDPLAAARAVRHFVLGEDDQHAGHQFALVVARARAIGDRRHARDILQELIGERLPDQRVATVLRGVAPWQRTPPVRMRRVAATAMVVASVSLLAAWYMVRKPGLIVAQSASLYLDVPIGNVTMLKTVPSIAIATGTGTGDTTQPSIEVRARSIDAHTKILSGDRARTDRGVALFNALRFQTTEPFAHIRFEAAGYRPVDVAVSKPDYVPGRKVRAGSSLRLVGGLINGQQLSPRSASVTVSPGALVQGYAQIEYTSTWVAASVWLSTTPSWGNPATAGREITPLITPVQREVTDVTIALKAPGEPGHYWVIYVMDAEPSGMYALSRTNWTFEKPVWNDGNDVAATPDSTIRMANAQGFAFAKIAIPVDWNPEMVGCDPVPQAPARPLVRYCDRPTPLFGIELIVR